MRHALLGRTLWPALLAIGLTLACRIDSCPDRSVKGDNAVSYDHIINTYLNAEAEREGIDLFGLWGALGLDRRKLKDSDGQYILGATKGQRTGFTTINTEHLGDTRVVAISRTYDGFQILVFRQQGEGPFNFVYAFNTRDRMADGPGLQLHAPEPGVLLLEAGYNNAHGTGLMGQGWSLYLLADDAAKLLLRTDAYGYEVGWSSLYLFGHLCDIKPIAETWPVVEMHLLAENVLPLEDDAETTKTDMAVIWGFEADVTWRWDARDATFRPDPHPILSADETRAVLDDQVSFVEEHISEASRPGRRHPLLTRQIVKESEWGRYTYPWGK